MASIPKLKHIVEQVYREGTYTLESLEGCGQFTRDCAVKLYEEDPRFVMLKKSAGRTHVVDAKGRRHGADAVLFLDQGKGTSVDIVGKSRTPEAVPAWTPDSKARYTVADGFVPDYRSVPTPVPNPGDDLPNSGDHEARIAALEAFVAKVRAL
jgi:hypothetical protein